MIVFGITGGTGAGKTSALRVLAELGAYLIDCDALYYEMLRPGTALHEDIGTAFGRDMFDASGALNRQKLGSLVFSAPQELQRHYLQPSGSGDRCAPGAAARRTLCCGGWHQYAPGPRRRCVPVRLYGGRHRAGCAAAAPYHGAGPHQ